jgi:cystathionine beta-lyase/cystathionine gamma-synthase
MAAIAGLVAMLKTGDHLVCSRDVYAGTVRLFEQIVSGYGIEVEYVDTSDLKAVEAAMRPNTKLVHIETPSNPLMVLTDIAGVAAIAHAHGAEVSVDNTFLSPALQSPLALGADIVMHSTTKYLNGHSDGLGGALIGSKQEHKERFLLVQKAAGGVMSPFECFLVLRGIKTMPLRVKQHEENGRAVAEFLSTHRKVSKLAYPGLKSHPQYDLAVKQQKGFGSMMSFELQSREEAGRFLAAIKIFLNAESLGGVESLASHSATTTHGSVSQEFRDAMGITERRFDCRSGSGAGGGVGLLAESSLHAGVGIVVSHPCRKSASWTGHPAESSLRAGAGFVVSHPCRKSASCMGHSAFLNAGPSAPLKGASLRMTALTFIRQ